MARYFTDFSEYTTGVQPSDWTLRWAASALWTVETLAGATGGQVLQFADGPDAPNLLSWDDIDADADRDDVEIVIRVLFPSSSSGQEVNVAGRGSGALGSQYAYEGGLERRSTTTITSSKYTSGTYALLDDLAFALSTDTWYWLRVRINGTSLQSRAWEEGDPEPATWQTSATDSDVTGVGWVGLRTYWGDAFNVDVFGVGTNGDAAPAFAPKTISVGQATETDSAFNVSLQGVVTLAVETDIAQAVGAGKRVTAALATEVDTAHGSTAAKLREVALTAETDSTFSVSGFKVLEIGLTTETDTAHDAAARENHPVGKPPPTISSAHPLSFGVPDFRYSTAPAPTVARRAARRRLSPIVFTDRADGTTYVLVLGSGMLIELQAFTPKPGEFVYAPHSEPTLVTAGVTFRVYVEGGALLYERYAPDVRTRPILFGKVTRPRARDNRYQLRLPEWVAA